MINTLLKRTNNNNLLSVSVGIIRNQSTTSNQGQSFKYNQIHRQHNPSSNWYKSYTPIFQANKFQQQQQQQGLSAAIATVVVKWFLYQSAAAFSTTSPNQKKAINEQKTAASSNDNTTSVAPDVNNNNNNNNNQATTSTTSATTTTTTSKVEEKKQPSFEIGDIEDMNKKCGFCRPEMVAPDKSPVAHSIHEYGRHYFICAGFPAVDFPAKFFTASEALEQIGAAIKSHDRDQLVPSIFNGCDASSSSSSDTGIDLLVFPENIRLVGMNQDRLERVLDFFSKNKAINDQFPQDVKIESFNEKFIFVCAHKLKDERCGYCGPILVDQLKEEIKERGLSKEIQVYGTSHVGGHKFAGNVLVFPPGHWYGYVTPSDVSEIIDSAVASTRVSRLLRGTMGEPVLKEKKKERH
ncbi:sucraseferredoxin-like family protein [Cavenderia fasciculata]|uniref:Sucraseferredoxin-like family protein n=1 Tax=Cavenderia fasciculata TaxID=261658 RepID=F4PM61_CACFS|nr:sucraseferredoxin-like family protein [Cavenderia fasciculata]EGG23561.1 sucraseferredoxin-like family protein [Cavenderia fasciculata]|eukprot:XP_004361412.1 sucraseferredoxin-like family protein [Cavenderia fasciculata]